jgi:hypothetical protein
MKVLIHRVSRTRVARSGRAGQVNDVRFLRGTVYVPVTARRAAIAGCFQSSDRLVFSTTIAALSSPFGSSLAPVRARRDRGGGRAPRRADETALESRFRSEVLDMNGYLFVGLAVLVATAIGAIVRMTSRGRITHDSVPQSVLDRIRTEDTFDAGR